MFAIKLHNQKSTDLLESLDMNGVLSDKVINFIGKKLLEMECKKYETMRDSFSSTFEEQLKTKTGMDIISDVRNFLNTYQIFSQEYKDYILGVFYSICGETPDLK